MTAPVKFHSFISSHSHCFNTDINLVFLTASWRHPAGISIQSGFIRSETTSGGRSSELRVSDQSILNTQAVQTHWGQRNHNTRRRSDDDDGDEEVQDVWWSRITFLFTAVDNLQIFGDSWTGVLVHMSVCETKATIVTDLSNQREDAIYCAGSCRTWDEHEAVIRYQFSKYCSKLFHSTSWISQVWTDIVFFSSVEGRLDVYGTFLWTVKDSRWALTHQCCHETCMEKFTSGYMKSAQTCMVLLEVSVRKSVSIFRCSYHHGVEEAQESVLKEGYMNNEFKHIQYQHSECYTRAAGGTESILKLNDKLISEAN